VAIIAAGISEHRSELENTYQNTSAILLTQQMDSTTQTCPCVTRAKWLLLLLMTIINITVNNLNIFLPKSVIIQAIINKLLKCECR
jgi:hypothetical protein